MPDVIVVAGATATGKTDFALNLAEKLDGEIVSADSMQVYRGMDIGTSKIRPEETRGIAHHMLDVADPRENYSVARYAHDGGKVCDDIIARGKTPIICGGTGLYIDALLRGTDFSETQEAKQLRSALCGKYENVGGEAMLADLSKFDPERAAKLSPGDKRRIVRAFEVFLLTGITATEHDRRSAMAPPRFSSKWYILGFNDREKLYGRINLRVEKMINDGLVDEVKGLLAAGLNQNHTSMQAIGYKEPAGFIRGEYSFDDMKEMICQNTRRYAKRQITWFRRYEGERIFMD